MPTPPASPSFSRSSSSIPPWPLQLDGDDHPVHAPNARLSALSAPPTPRPGAVILAPTALIRHSAIGAPAERRENPAVYCHWHGDRWVAVPAPPALASRPQDRGDAWHLPPVTAHRSENRSEPFAQPAAHPSDRSETPDIIVPAPATLSEGQQSALEVPRFAHPAGTSTHITRAAAFALEEAPSPHGSQARSPNP